MTPGDCNYAASMHFDESVKKLFSHHAQWPRKTAVALPHGGCSTPTTELVTRNQGAQRALRAPYELLVNYLLLA
jgi:hypothetical protein